MKTSFHIRLFVMFRLLFWLLFSTLFTVGTGALHFVPKIEYPNVGGDVKITIIKMEECGEPEQTVFCSNKDLSAVRNTAAVICRSIMDAFYTTGDAVRKEMTVKEGDQVEKIGYDFSCLGSENNLDQCEGERVVCHDKIVVKCSQPGISGICKSPCGCMAPTLLAKVVGGLDALPGEFPWQVSLSLGKYICGGTIIDSEHILTAAHCIHQPGAKYVPCKAQKSSAGDEIQECSWVSSIKVYYGSSEWFSSQNSNAEEAIVQKIFIHKDYVRGRRALYHDIAVIRLKVPLELNPYVQPVCLPRDDFVLPTDKNVTVSGFGDTSRFSGVYPDTLQKASLKWLEVEECNKVMFGFLRDEHFCAGDTSGRVDACRGDSGGPLVYKNERGIATLVGLVSFSYGCAVRGLWSVYADVRKERDFIDSILTDSYDKNTIILSCHLKNGRCKKM